MAIDIDSLSKDIGITVRNAIRLDSFFKNYVYIGDYREVTTGKITSGTNILTVVDTSKISVGDKIGIMGAGDSSTRLVSTVTSKSINTITITDNALTTVSSASVLLFETTSVAKNVNNWIFLGRPKQQGDTTSTKIFIEIIDGTPEERKTHDGKVETSTVFVIHYFLDKDKAQSYDDYDFNDKLKSIIRKLRSTNPMIKQCGVLSGYSSDEDENGKIWTHGLVRGFIEFREG